VQFKKPYDRDLRQATAVFPYILLCDINLMINRVGKNKRRLDFMMKGFLVSCIK